MISVETLRRLEWHAGLNADTVDDAAPVLASAEADHGSDVALVRAVTDFIDTLKTLNVELNGEVPSDSTNHVDDVPRSAAYAVAEVIRVLRQGSSRETGALFARLTWLVETAWSAVLAGDIDDLWKHLEDEEAMRTVPFAPTLFHPQRD